MISWYPNHCCLSFSLPLFHIVRMFFRQKSCSILLFYSILDTVSMCMSKQLRHAHNNCMEAERERVRAMYEVIVVRYVTWFRNNHTSRSKILHAYQSFVRTYALFHVRTIRVVIWLGLFPHLIILVRTHYKKTSIYQLIPNDKTNFQN